MGSSCISTANNVHKRCMTFYAVLNFNLFMMSRALVTFLCAHPCPLFKNYPTTSNSLPLAFFSMIISPIWAIFWFLTHNYFNINLHYIRMNFKSFNIYFSSSSYITFTAAVDAKRMNRIMRMAKGKREKNEG